MAKNTRRSTHARAHEPDAEVPAGFEQVETNLVGFWKPENPGSTLQGVVESVVTTEGQDGRPNQFYAVRLTSNTGGPIVNNDGQTLDTEAGARVGVGGAMLASFLKTRIGKEVYLIYKGLGSPKKGRSAAKLYDCYERPNADNGRGRSRNQQSDEDIPF